MAAKLICYIGQIILLLRYRVKIKGIKNILEKGNRGILLLPNHPALIDPVILMCCLFPYFRQRTLSDKDQADRPVIKWFATLFKVIKLPDAAKYGSQVLEEVDKSLKKCSQSLDDNKNVIIYPAGHIKKSKFENIGANSGISTILENCRKKPRIVLVNTSGLWGSDFSRADGKYPSVEKILKKSLKVMLFNLIFFIPKRKVTIEFFEAEDFPFDKSKNEINSYLEDFYNKKAHPRTYNAYYFFEKNKTQILAEPEKLKLETDMENISQNVITLVNSKIHEISGIKTFSPDAELASTLGMDSLSRVELAVWIEKEFGFNIPNPDVLELVSDVYAAAAGESLAEEVKLLNKVHSSWYSKEKYEKIITFDESCNNIAEYFLKSAAKNLNQPVIADQKSGIKTYKNLITGILIFSKVIKKLEGEYVGIMLPASVGAVISYFSVMFSGKTPVMINWTVGERNMKHSAEMLKINHILTSKLLVEKLEAQGAVLGEVKPFFMYLEDIIKKISLFDKLKAVFSSGFNWSSLKKQNISDTAVVLFTSGSESLPKAVPLTHRNILTNIKDIISLEVLRENDAILGFLPPFHSFGITVTMLLPILSGFRVVFHPNPTEGGTLAKMCELYRPTILVGTPTFLGGILKGAQNSELKTLKLGVTGAEKCSVKIYEALQSKCPDMVILEGYGITECSPVVSVNRPQNIVPYSIGNIMNSVEYKIIDIEKNIEVEKGEQGMLIVRGPSIFNGYINYEGDSPFIDFEEKSWYKTGDLVKEDENGVLTFMGRLKRFIKLGGEMISMPAIEEVLNKKYQNENDEGPVIAVETLTDEENPEIILFTTLNISREEINSVIRESGLSALHNIRKVIKIDEIPVLGTGKTNYRELKQRL